MAICHADGVPKLWSDTIAEHRRAVRDAILDATAALVADQGFTSVTMSRIAKETGIGRATLYKYFPDRQAILVAWHERQIADHLQLLADIRDRATGPAARLEAVLRAYADISHQRRDTDLAALLHRGEHVAHAQEQLHDLVRQLINDGAKTGELRGDVSSHELATFCLHALTAASPASSKPAVARLVDVTLDGLRQPGQAPG